MSYPTHSTMYLFGIEPAELEDMLYPLALAYKYDMARELYLLLEEEEPEYQDKDRMFYVLQARDKTLKLINELKCPV